MREHVSQSKKATTASFSIPSLKHRIPGFGLESSQASPQAVPLVQPLHKPLTHDISRMSLHRPQAKLSISQPGDKYEQEADSVAQQVMQRMAQPVNRQSIQPQALPEESELQMKPMANSITPLVQREALPEEEEELQMKSLDNSRLQRQEAPEDEEELQMKPMVQRRAEARMADAPDLEASINQARGGGQAMAENIRHPMEVAFGADFRGVKVHTDGQSDQLNRSINARAFTTKQDVFFRQGEYNPGSRGGQELLAHELTHVVQQNGGAVQRSPLSLPVVNFAALNIPGAITHVSQRDFTVSRNRGIGGCHDRSQWDSLRSAPTGTPIPTGLQVTDHRVPEVLIVNIANHPSAPSVHLINYKIPSLDRAQLTDGSEKNIRDPKTTYDPTVWTIPVLTQSLQEALQDASNSNGGTLPTQWTGSDRNGVALMGFIRQGQLTTFFFE
ncbi:MAG: DUF4157 domain-containing protein [Nostoc sp.]|uniref:eCIS core domain-containing protein n=1 Tax=Nostoc sp. TaxID=1180 RepID=UPI002FF6DB05